MSFNEGQTFLLALASLLEIGYQVSIPEAGAFGVSQLHKDAFVWAAYLEETLPDWQEVVHSLLALTSGAQGDSFK